MTAPLDKSSSQFPELFQDEVFRLETRRLWLRWPTVSDIATLEGVAAREASARDGTAWPRPAAETDPAHWIEAARCGNAVGSKLDLVLALKARPQELIGLIGVRPIPRSETLSMGFLLDVEHQGRGLMTEAVRAFVGAVFRYTAWKGIRGSSRIDNVAARRVLEKAGFRCVKQRPAARDSTRGTGRHVVGLPLVDCQSLELRRAQWTGKSRSDAPHRVEASVMEVPCGCGA